MAFNSAAFLFFFFPAAFLLYAAVPGIRVKNALLAVFSLIFYAFGQWQGLPLLLLAVLISYGAGRMMDRPAAKKPVTVLALVLDLGLLGCFKYLDFFTGILNRILPVDIPAANLLLPVGISFFIFKSMSYVIDAYRDGGKASRNFLDVLLYVSFFPQITSGPITRFDHFAAQLRSRPFDSERTARGLRRFIVGFGKKMLIAGPVSAIVDSAFSLGGALDIRMAWLGAVAYTIQIYFDFSGYSDMAIGLGRIFGFHFLENFDHPYAAVSITDFWRRWHISLSTWFRDYIYIPLGGNRVGRGRWMLNILIVWGLTGFWHGAQWNFLLWGLYYAVLLVVEKLWLHKALDKLPRFVGWLYAMFFVTVGWVLFNLTDFSRLLAALGQMFIYRPTDWVAMAAADLSVLYGLFFLPLGLVWMLPMPKKLRLGQSGSAGALAASNLIHLALAGVCVVIIISSKYNPFIYFRF